MRALVQRVSRASVTSGGAVTGAIDRGLLVLLGVARTDTDQDLRYIADKILHLRIFDDHQGKMNCSLLDTGGAILLVSQFTLYGSVKKGRRPGFHEAAEPALAEELYREMRALLSRAVPVETGSFGQAMKVELINDGPVTIMIDSAEKFLS
ncbi:D-tyrosyl-tRNA(Tyr) deacylase [Alkalispirochaeta sphaeroplastigenens]|uniref:D-aminoacyl-tRNA deacylase n=1 Tax=Alkalispirochaeta sphaeroplastigenens TaxID=1187066 RepID=A0A2S4K0B9_9SPIO|nr:D-aminoacyl-tRNA deacylase [Alkalispirochaeta sphaeroplastigenens]POR05214.1 D-tyrosyl-tRNA(Tyr) deacylase [Alkalispirochaeta sphaeroplastigenens]